MTEFSNIQITEYIAMAYERLELTYSPYSQFPVSAVLVMQDTTIFTGVNIENVSFGATVCAERVAIFSAINAGYRQQEFMGLFVIAKTEKPVAPCCLCRQVMTEFFAPALPIFLANNKQEYIMTTAEQLIPYAFSELK